jgi:hypothetical protein
MGSWHDPPAYREDTGVSDTEPDYDFDNDRWDDLSSSYARVACGYGVSRACMVPLLDVFFLLDSVLLDLYPACAEEMYSD